jgi:integrase
MLDRDGAHPAFLRAPTTLPRPAPVDELAVFASKLNTWRDRALIALLVGAGLRLSEVLGLRLGDLDWGGKRVFVRRGKGGRQRYAMAPDPASAALKAYLEVERPEPPADSSADEAVVFVALQGPHPRAGNAPNVTPHRLRHTCGTELHRAELSLELIQEQLGHRRVDSTRLYVHQSNERLRAAYEAIQARLYCDPLAPEVP